MKNIHIENRIIGIDRPTYFVADIAANHDGDLVRAKELIHMAAEAGADAAKFQNFKATKIVSDFGFKSLGEQASHQTKWKKSVVEVYADASIPDDWTLTLAQECQKRGIHYSTSPYDFASVEHTAAHVAFFKVGSGDLTWPDIYLYMAHYGKPIFLATGASHMGEVEYAVSQLSSISSEIVVMQCNTNYTGSRENFRYLNLRVLSSFASRWPDAILGFSDHTPGYSAVLGAVALGARVVEKHFTDDTKRDGPDHAFSLTPQVWQEMVNRTRELEDSLGDGVKRVEDNERETVVLQRRALRATKVLQKGHTITEEDVIALRPAPRGALPPFDMDAVIGKKLSKTMSQGEHFCMSHLIRSLD